MITNFKGVLQSMLETRYRLDIANNARAAQAAGKVAGTAASIAIGDDVLPSEEQQSEEQATQTAQPTDVQKSLNAAQKSEDSLESAKAIKTANSTIKNRRREAIREYHNYLAQGFDVEHAYRYSGLQIEDYLDEINRATSNKDRNKEDK